jgi:uncharacterized protein (DUF433 family)
MVKHFNRIIRDFSKFGGQPYVESTSITVNQILTKSTNGLTIAEILDEYPQLTADDIHQALSFAIKDIFSGVSYWRHDGMTPLTQIKGYSEILVGKTEFDDLDTIPENQKSQWLSIIHTSSQRGIARWQQMSQWMSKQYSVQPFVDTEIYELEQLINDIVTVAQNYEPSLEIEVSEIDSYVNLETHMDTALILGSILAYAKNTFKPEILITLNIFDDSVKIHFNRQLLYPDDDLQKLLTIPYSPFTTALTFFYEQSTYFEINQTEDNVIFTIELPVWKE